MDFLSSYLIVISVSIIAMVSPGPDFLITMRNALGVGRASGIATAVGIGMAILVHMTYCILGIAVVISQSILLFNIIKYIGAGYLFWLGYKALRSKGWDMHAEKARNKSKSLKKSWAEGFVTNVFNPKATLFFLALFTQVIAPATPLAWQIIYGGTVALMATTWFTFVSVALTQRHIRQFFGKISVWIDRTTGVLFIALGLKIATEKLN